MRRRGTKIYLVETKPSRTLSQKGTYQYYSILCIWCEAYAYAHTFAKPPSVRDAAGERTRSFLLKLLPPGQAVLQALQDRSPLPSRHQVRKSSIVDACSVNDLCCVCYHLEMLRCYHIALPV